MAPWGTSEFPRQFPIVKTGSPVQGVNPSRGTHEAIDHGSVASMFDVADREGLCTGVRNCKSTRHCRLFVFTCGFVLASRLLRHGSLGSGVESAADLSVAGLHLISTEGLNLDDAAARCGKDGARQVRSLATLRTRGQQRRTG